MYIRPPVPAGCADRVTSSPTLDVRIWRGADAGDFVAYKVPAAANQTVLDVVTWVQRHLDPALAYRFACRVGVCGSCAMTVNGRARWTCRSHVKDVAGDGRLVVEPLRNLPRIKDLVCDLAPFLRQVAARGRALRRDVDPARPDARNRPRHGCAAHGGRGHRVHQLRGVLQRLRRGGVAPGLSRTGRAQSRLDADQRRTARRDPRGPRRGLGRRRLHRLPHPRKLHRATARSVSAPPRPSPDSSGERSAGGCGEAPHERRRRARRCASNAPAAEAVIPVEAGVVSSTCS